MTTSTSIKLNFEHTDYQWILLEDLSKYHSVPGLPEAWSDVSE